jgi:hypothetical protein
MKMKNNLIIKIFVYPILIILDLILLLVLGIILYMARVELKDDDDMLAGLNRDTDNAQELTKNEITGALDGSITVDNRVFTSAGRENIANQHRDFIGNAGKALGDAWTLPNTILGDMIGFAGLPFGAEYNYVEESGMHEFKNNPLMFFGAGVSLGNVVNYSGDPDNRSLPNYTYAYVEYVEEYRSESEIPRLPNANDMINIRAHETAHRKQGVVLGPLYIPTYYLSGGASSGNWMEKKPDLNGNNVWRQKNGR